MENPSCDDQASESSLPEYPFLSSGPAKEILNSILSMPHVGGVKTAIFSMHANTNKKNSRNQGDIVMRIAIAAGEAKDSDISLADYNFSEEEKGSVFQRKKFNITVEKKIERLWLDAKQLDWDYQSFVVFILEVLTIMHYRNNVGQNQETGLFPGNEQQQALSEK
jgi:hypothetical protein